MRRSSTPSFVTEFSSAKRGATSWPAPMVPLACDRAGPRVSAWRAQGDANARTRTAFATRRMTSPPIPPNAATCRAPVRTRSSRACVTSSTRISRWRGESTRRPPARPRTRRRTNGPTPPSWRRTPRTSFERSATCSRQHKTRLSSARPACSTRRACRAGRVRHRKVQAGAHLHRSRGRSSRNNRCLFWTARLRTHRRKAGGCELVLQVEGASLGDRLRAGGVTSRSPTAAY